MFRKQYIGYKYIVLIMASIKNLNKVFVFVLVQDMQGTKQVAYRRNWTFHSL